MANKKITELSSRTPALSDLMLVGDPSSGYSYKCTVTALATIIETDIADGYVTIGTTQTISGAKTFSNNLTLTSVSNAAVTQTKFLTLNASNVVNYRTGAEVLADIGGQGALTLTTSGSSGAATLVGNTLNIPQYQSVITNPVTGTGVANYITKWASSSSISNSQLYDNGTNVGIGVDANIVAGYLLTIGGKVKFYNQIDLDNPTTNTCNTINIQKGTSISHRGAGYIQIASFNTNRLSLFFNDNNNYQADFDGSNLTSGRRYILPDATGTLALTSDLSSYVPTSRTLTINGTTFDLSANRTWSVGTVTSVGLSSATSGVTIGSTPITTSGTITLAIATASGSQQGLLSSTDWTTFNNKQNAITLTTTGTSGAATLVGSTLNIPQYQAALTNPVTGTGTTTYLSKFTGTTSIGNSMITEGAANEVALEGNGTTGGSLNLKHYASFSGKGVGYSWIGVSSNNYWFQSQTASGTKSFYFDITNNTLNSVRQYIMPNASGTLALTSDITSAISGTTNYIPKFTSSSAIGNSTIQTDATGNLMVGSSDAGNAGTINVSVGVAGTTAGGLQLWASNSQTHYIQFGDGTTGGQPYAGFLGYAHSADALVFGTATSERMRLTSGGSLGIGTSSPAYKLDVNGTGGFADNVIAQKGQNATTKFEAKNTTVGTSSDAAFIATSDASTGQTVFGKKSSGVTTYKILTPSAAYWYNGTAGDIAIINDFGSGAIKMSAGGSSTAQLTLNTSGNLGLGVTPSAWQTFKAIQINGGNSFVGAANQAEIWSNSYFDGGFKYYGTGLATRFASIDGQFQWFQGPSGTAGNAISFTQAMTLDASGNLLVGGTSSSGERLQVTGNAMVQGEIRIRRSGTQYGTLYASSGNDLFLESLNSAAIYYNSVASLHTWRNNGTNAMTLNSTGLGIGTTSPTALLNISGAGSSAKIQVESTTTQAGQVWFKNGSTSSTGFIVGLLGDTSGDGVLYHQDAKNITFYTTASERMRITSGGELLINTTSDAGDYKLQVNGSVYIGTGYNLDFGTTASLFASPSTGHMYFEYAASNSLIFRDKTSGAVALTLTSSENAEFGGSIKTAAPSGGTAKPIKFGEIVSLGGSNTQGVRVEIDGTVYYLVTGYLP